MKYEVFWKNPGYPGHPQLTKNIECDVLIVGGGITGVALAYFLGRKNKKKIVLIERNTIASGATGKAAGSIVLKGELDLKEILKIYGHAKGIRYWKENHKGLALMKSIIKKENIKCDYDAQDTIYGSTYKNTDVLEEYIIEKDIEKITKLLVGKELTQTINTPLFKYALLSHQQGVSVNPLQFTQNLSVKVSKKKYAQIFEYTPLVSLKQSEAITPRATIKFKKIIFATDSNIRSSKIKKIASTIVVTKPLTRTELKKTGLVPKKIVWDSKDIYHYLKITRDNRILLGYGDKHTYKKSTGIEPHKPHFIRIERFLSKLFPNVKTEIEYAWSGYFGLAPNKVPYIDQKKNRVYVGGAASQVVCLMAAKHIADKIKGIRSSLDEFF